MPMRHAQSLPFGIDHSTSEQTFVERGKFNKKAVDKVLNMQQSRLWHPTQQSNLTMLVAGHAVSADLGDLACL